MTMNAKYFHVKTMGHVSIQLGRMFVTVLAAGRIKTVLMVRI